MRNSLAPGVYFGSIQHRRFTPVAHEFRYGIFMTWLDIDRIPELMGVSIFSGYEKRRLLSFQERDHFGDPALPLRERLRRDAEAQGLALPNGPIYLLTNLRFAGYCFNPISFFYCYDAQERLQLTMAEVHNTFGEIHNYWLGPHNADGEGRWRTAKRLHVSPFNTMDNEYGFVCAPPGEALSAHIDNYRDGERFLNATLTMQWEAWSARTLRKAIAAFPLMTWQVIAAIHWQALQLYFKRLPVVPRSASGECK